MGVVKFLQGYAKNRLGKNVPTLEAALAEVAKCSPCGCDPCTGIETFVNHNTETCEKEVWGRFCVDGEVIKLPLDEAKAAVKELCTQNIEKACC